MAEEHTVAPLPKQVKLDSALTPPTASLQICAQARSRFQSQRDALVLMVGYCFGFHSHLFGIVLPISSLVAQSLAHVAPFTLDLYSRGVILLQQWMSLVTIMMRVRAAARHDAQINRIQSKSFLQCLRWLAKTAEMPTLSTLLASELLSCFLKGSGDISQRKEALPLPFAVLVAWERAITQDFNWTNLLLGGFLLAVWASLRFGDLQRCDVDSLNLANAILRGSCSQTKVTKQGQPFAVILAGFTASSSATSWVVFWLRHLQTASRAVAPFKPH